MKEIAMLVAAFVLGFAMGIGLAAAPYRTAQDELTALKHEAIRRGFAHYTNDLNGNSTFVWREK